jgi:hypothetical protein
MTIVFTAAVLISTVDGDMTDRLIAAAPFSLIFIGLVSYFYFYYF